MTSPGSLGIHAPRIAPLEEETFTVNARVISATIEDDSDIHLVIAQRGTRTRTMIVEFPDQSCVASPFKRDRIRQARLAMLSNCGQSRLRTSSISMARWP